MRKVQKIRYIAIAAGVVLLTGWQMAPLLAKQLGEGLSASASDDDDWAGCVRKHFEKQFFKRIDATKEQEEKISALIDNAVQENAGTRADIKEKVRSLVDSFGDSGSSDDKLRQQAAELRTLHEKLMDRRLDTALKVRALMTPEQRQTVVARFKQRFDGFFGRKVFNES